MHDQDENKSLSQNISSWCFLFKISYPKCRRLNANSNQNASNGKSRLVVCTSRECNSPPPLNQYLIPGTELNIRLLYLPPALMAGAVYHTACFNSRRRKHLHARCCQNTARYRRSPI